MFLPYKVWENTDHRMLWNIPKNNILEFFLLAFVSVYYLDSEQTYVDLVVPNSIIWILYLPKNKNLESIHLWNIHIIFQVQRVKIFPRQRKWKPKTAAEPNFILLPTGVVELQFIF